MSVTFGPVGNLGVPVLQGRSRLIEPDEWANPWPIYRQVRDEAPLYYVPEFDEIVATTWADCERVLRDSTFSSAAKHRRQLPDAATTPTALDLPAILLFMDPPDHTRLRRLVSRAFTPRTIEQLRPQVAALVDGMIDDLDRSGFDLIETIGYPLPVTVICKMLGVPVEDIHLFGPWSSDLSRMLDGDLTEADVQAGVAAFLQIAQYLNELFAERRKAPGDDLVSALLAVEEAGDTLDEQELMSVVLLLFVAGHETTMNLIGNGTVALMRHRGEWDRLCADPDLAPGAVEELLRFDGPVHVTIRTATAPAQVGGIDVEQGQAVLCHLAAANRDPSRFADADGLHIGRKDPQHLTFSHGIHYCLGAALARLEGQEVFRALSQRLPDLELTAEPIHREHFVLRGYGAVHLRA